MAPPRPQVVVVTTTLLLLILPCRVRADFSYAHDAEEYYTAIVNLTYVNPSTGLVVSEREELGKYSAGKVGSVSGVVVHVTSKNFTAHDACSPLDTINIPQEPWIALIQHGNCIESVKMRHAASTNASGAVVYNNNPGNRLVKMRHKGKGRSRADCVVSVRRCALHSKPLLGSCQRLSRPRLPRGASRPQRGCRSRDALSLERSLRLQLTYRYLRWSWALDGETCIRFAEARENILRHVAAVLFFFFIVSAVRTSGSPRGRVAVAAFAK